MFSTKPTFVTAINPGSSVNPLLRSVQKNYARMAKISILKQERIIKKIPTSALSMSR